MARNNLSKRAKFFLFLELIFIFVYLLCALSELIFVMKMYLEHMSSDQYYFYHLIHKRIRLTSFNSELELRSKDAECPMYVPLPDSESPTQLTYTPRKILELGIISNALLKNVTLETNIYDPSLPDEKIILNTTFSTALSYNFFDLQKSGNSTIELMTNYRFTSWKKTQICVIKLILKNQLAFALIPKEKSCQEFPNQNPGIVDCGTYLDTYKMCSNTDNMQFNDTSDAAILDRNGWPEDWACPFNYFAINFEPNPHYDSSDPDSLPIKGELFGLFFNRIDNPADMEKYGDKIDKYLFYDLDNAILGKYQQIENPEDIFVFASASETEFTVGSEYGFLDSFNGKIESYNFMTIYNETYFKESVHNPETGKTTYLPEFFNGLTDMSYYQPEDTSKEHMKISLTYWAHPVLSAECFNEFIIPNEYWYYWKHVEDIGTEFLNESLPLLLSWVLVQLFISYFWHFQIRKVLILQMYNKGYLNGPDAASEFITKFTSKLVGAIMFALLLHGTFYHNSKFNFIFGIADGVIQYKCYPDQITLDSFAKFKEYVTTLNGSNSMLIYLLSTCVCMEAIIFFYYIFEVMERIKERKQAEQANLVKLKTQ